MAGREVTMPDSSGANTYGLSDFESPSGSTAFERMLQDNGAGEFSYGAGLDVPGYEDKPPAEGGRYKGQVPPCAKVIGVGNR
jgi:hypothetical protein